MAARVPRHDTLPTLLGQRLRAARTRRGWSQLQLAAYCGLNAQMVSRIERSVTHAPRMTTMAALARALDVAPSWLLRSDLDAPGGP